MMQSFLVVMASMLFSSISAAAVPTVIRRAPKGQETLEVAQAEIIEPIADGKLEMSFVAIASMERSSSTLLLYDVLLKAYHPCFVALNEIFLEDPSQSGDAWAVDGTELGPVHKISPSNLEDFLVRVARRRCLQQAEMASTCGYKCLVGWKQFGPHLNLEQHAYILQHTPNMSVVVLEQDVVSRWQLYAGAMKTGDSNTMISQFVPPPVDPKFKQIHDDWFTFVRATVPSRIEINLEDVISDGGTNALKKIRPPQFAAFPFPPRLSSQARIVDREADEQLEMKLTCIASAQRSSSTFLLFDVMNRMYDPCFVPLNEIFLQDPQQSGDAWDKEGARWERGNVFAISPSDLEDFLVKVAKRRCLERPEMASTCGYKCHVGWKQFDFHLNYDQHAYILQNTPNMSVAVLERDVESRWKSSQWAKTTGDWNTRGSADHEEQLRQFAPGPVDPKFKQTHDNWFAFVRATVPDRVELNFQDVVSDDGSKAIQKIQSKERI